MNKHIKTEITIAASKEKVWDLLTGFTGYPEWNPFFQSLEGELVAGNRLNVTIRNENQLMRFKPVVNTVSAPTSFSWTGSLVVKGLFDGVHYFEIEELGNNQVKLVHGEKFSGLLSGIILKKIGPSTRAGFIKMNEALKRRAEQTSTT